MPRRKLPPRPYKPNFRAYAKRLRKTTRGIRRTVSHGNSKIHYITRVAELDNITINDTSNQELNFKFSLSQLPGVGDFTALFDLYRILKIQLSIIPQFNTNQLSAAVGVPTGIGSSLAINQVHSAIDYDFDGTAFNKFDLMQYQTYKQTREMKKHMRTFYPKYRISTDSTDTIHLSIPNRQVWLSCEDPTYQVGSVLASVDSPFDTTPSEGVAIVYQVYAKFWLAFKNAQ